MPTTLITGATDGIGLALARRLDRRGERLILLGRRAPEALPQDARELIGRHLYVRVDLADRGAADAVRRRLHDHDVDALDRLILNAARGFHGDVAGQDPAALRALVELNLMAPIELTHALAPLLSAARGRVVFVSSVVSSLPSPRYAVYSATKAALEGFARSLRIEARGTFQVQVVRPGATRTGLHRKMGIDRSEMDWTTFPSAEATAARFLRALDGRARDVTLGAGNALVHRAGRLAPELIARVMRRSGGALEGGVARPSGSGPSPRCVVTGAADGIGRALALRLSRQGYEIVGVDRDRARSAHTCDEIRAAGGKVTFLDADLSDPDDVERVAATLAGGPPIDMLIHNAGISAVGRFTALPAAAQRAVLQVNLLAPLHLTTALLRAGALAPAPRIVHLGSLSSFTGYPGAAVYAASKDGVASWARSLSVALGPRARVLTVCPGPVRTRHAERYSPAGTRADRRMPPEALAKRIADALRRGRRGTLVPGVANRAAAVVGRLAPRVMESVMKRVILDRLDREGGAPKIVADAPLYGTSLDP